MTSIPISLQTAIERATSVTPVTPQDAPSRARASYSTFTSRPATGMIRPQTMGQLKQPASRFA